MKTDLSKNNPFASYNSDFASNFTFGEDFDGWVCDTMLPALSGGQPLSVSQSLVDIGAGPCYWAKLLLQRAPSYKILAVDPSEDLIENQANSVLADSTVSDRLTRRCETVQSFAQYLVEQKISNQFDCMYFMQSAHYIGHSEFKDIMSKFAATFKSGGRVVIQARNMTPDWYPWAFPDEWVPSVEKALNATDMFYRADRYVTTFNEMSDVFQKIDIYEKETTVKVPCQDYWQRLENRWISTFMSESIIDAKLHRAGIDSIKARYDKESRSTVDWIEKFAVITAYI